VCSGPLAPSHRCCESGVCVGERVRDRCGRIAEKMAEPIEVPTVTAVDAPWDLVQNLIGSVRVRVDRRQASSEVFDEDE
jgi:hypothetical protein